MRRRLVWQRRLISEKSDLLYEYTARELHVESIAWPHMSNSNDRFHEKTNTGQVLYV